MTRMNLFQLRLAATAFTLLVMVVVVRLLWYPGGYAATFGVGKFLLITAAVALVIGPGLSTFVYSPGKRGLLLDMSVLAVVEFAVLIVSLHLLHERRPVYTVFAVDRFEVLSAQEIDRDAIAYAEILGRPGHEPRLLYAMLPTHPEAQRQLFDDVLFDGQADIDRRPEFWKPYAAGIRAVKSGARPLAALLEHHDPRATDVRRWLARHAREASDYIYLPLRGRHKDATMIVHADIGFPVAILPLDPW